MKEIRGRCLCGAVEYSIPDALIYAGYCHCSECRRWTGSPFSASGGVSKSDFKILKGRDNLTCYKKGEDTLSYFCNTCSSILYGDMFKIDMIYILLGTLDESPSLKPQWHAYTTSKADWYEINDGLPQFETKLSEEMKQHNKSLEKEH